MSLKLKMCILIKSYKISHVFRLEFCVGIEGIDGCVDAWQRRDFSNRRVMPAFQPHWLAIGRAISRSLEVIGCARATQREPITRWLGILSFNSRCQSLLLLLLSIEGSRSFLTLLCAFSKKSRALSFLLLWILEFRNRTKALTTFRYLLFVRGLVSIDSYWLQPFPQSIVSAKALRETLA